MPVCRSHRFAYVHVQKTAGTSFNEALTSAGLNLEFYGRGVTGLFEEHPRGLEIFRRFEDVYPGGLNVYAQAHLPAAVLRELLGCDLWDSYFTFAFVRNPWDRVVSIYHYLKELMSKPGAEKRQPEIFALINSSSDFPSFLEAWCPVARDVTSLLVDDNGAQIVDFVGRYERLGEDVARISQRIGVPLDLPHQNASKHDRYRSYYTPAARAIVAQTFARDIERFEYVF